MVQPVVLMLLSYHIFQLHLNLSVNLGHLKQSVSCNKENGDSIAVENKYALIC